MNGKSAHLAETAGWMRHLEAHLEAPCHFHFGRYDGVWGQVLLHNGSQVSENNLGVLQTPR